MKASQNTPPHFDEEIRLLDIFYFFKLHKKLISILIILGMILGIFFANVYGPVYEGSAMISPAKISGDFILKPKTTVTRLQMNNFYSKEALLNCKPYPNKYFNNDIPNIVNFSVTKDGELILISMQHKNKILIKNCLDSLVNDVLVSQNKIITPLIKSKNNELMLADQKLRGLEEFKNLLKNKVLKELKKNNSPLDTTSALLHSSLISANNIEISQTQADIFRLKDQLSPHQIIEAEQIQPIAIIKSFPTGKHGALFGLFFGLCLGILIALLKQIKI